MASSSSSSLPRTWKYRVFTSFHGPDVRKAFLSHLRKQFSFNGISMFDDQGIERGQTIAPALTQAIRESRISTVVLSEKYASSSWCLDELVEIFKCKEEMGQIVMTVFYGVDPSNVRKQTGEFGRVFNETCAGRTEEERRVWSQALTDAGNIAGEHNWDNESKMIEKIAGDVSKKLNITVSKDFEDMVGIEAHLEKMLSLLRLEDEDEALIVGIFGPAGIGKTTIARALHSRLSTSFQLSCFIENVSGSYNRSLDEYGLKLRLQKNLLSKILNQKDMKINHLGAIPEMLCDQKVLIILDDVDDMEQLEALVNETSWFGNGSRIILTSKDQEVLEQHDINITYHVDFPTKYDAREILCKKAFRRSFPPYGFENLVKRVIELCSNLPLGLCVIGSTLRGKNEDDWEGILRKLERSIDRKVEAVLRVGYENLHKDDQLLFLLIAFFFNYQDEDYVKAMVADYNFDARLGFGLKTLAYRSLIQKSTEGKIVMHKLLQQAGREVIQRQEPWKRQILIDTNQICDVLENDSGGGSVIGITFDISTLSRDVYISPRAFDKIGPLLFLNVYKTRLDTNAKVHVPEGMNFQSGLRLLHWDKYPGKCLPPTFRPEYLVELNLFDNKLEKLWEGIQPLTNLKKMSLNFSKNLKELPNLSNASNLEKLELCYCFSLIEIPSSFENLQKLKSLDMPFCVNLQVVPTHLNLASLEDVHIVGCYQLRNIPELFKNIIVLFITDIMLQDLPESVRLSSRLQSLYISNDRVESFSNIFGNELVEIDWSKDLLEKRDSAIKNVDVEDIEKLPDWIKDFHGLQELLIVGCPKLASLPELPASLRILFVANCESLETLIPFPFKSAIEHLCFYNCLKLGEEARRVITHQSTAAMLPGENIPVEFNHRAIGKVLTIPSCTTGFRICVKVSLKRGMKKGPTDLLWHLSCNGFTIAVNTLFWNIPKIETEHLYVRRYTLREKLESDALLEFSTTSNDLEIIECSFQIIMDETSSCYESVSEDSEQVYENDDESL